MSTDKTMKWLEVMAGKESKVVRIKIGAFEEAQKQADKLGMGLGDYVTLCILKDIKDRQEK